MTLGENKKIALALIEEYSATNPYLTDDEDIQSRLNLVYAPNYQEQAQNKKIIKTKILKEITGTTEEGYEEYSLPSNMYQMRKIFALDEKNREVEPDYKIIGKKIYINKESDATYILEYFVYPSVITEETSNDFVLEIDQDVQMILPYGVANDILKSDPSSDYTAFLAEYKRKLDSLDTRREIASIVVDEGVL
jgi:hypothetical protein